MSVAQLYLAQAMGVAGFHKRVALKLLRPKLSTNPDRFHTFLDEARFAALLDHPNIASVLDLGRHGRDYYIAMEYVEGLDLRTVFQQVDGAPLPLPAALHIALSVAGALQHAHDRIDHEGNRVCLLHRDVSPKNIVLRRDGEVKLIDFGIVRWGHDEPRPGYAAPEAHWGQMLDPRADVFGVGAVLYEALTGKRCFPGVTAKERRKKTDAGDYVPLIEARPGVPERLSKIVDAALHPDPDKRIATADALRQELLHFCADCRVQPSSAEVKSFLDVHSLEFHSRDAIQDFEEIPLETNRSGMQPLRRRPGPARVRPWSARALPLLAVGGVLAVLLGIGAWVGLRAARAEPAAAPHTESAPSTAPSNEAPMGGAVARDPEAGVAVVPESPSDLAPPP